MEDEEGEWSYSTGPGTTMLDVLREKFWEASFRDVPSWQPWATVAETSTTWQGGVGTQGSMDTRFHLASPKLHADKGFSRSRATDHQLTGPTTSSLGEALRGIDQDMQRMQGAHDMSQAGLQKQVSHRRVERRDTQEARPAGQAPVWAPGVWPQQQFWGPPPIQASFDGSC